MRRIFSEFNPEKVEQVRTHPYYATIREQIITKADYYITHEPEVIKFSKIHLYVTTGNREIFERVHTDYQLRLQHYFLAYILTEDEKYIEPLSDILWNICDFESWSIPAHVNENLSIVRRRRNLDLCSCLLGHRIAEVLYYIGDKLPELVYRRAKEEVTYRVIDSFAEYTEKEFWWYTVTNNWASVCISGVLGAYLYLADDEKIKEQLPKMMKIADHYLDGYEEDGCCLEGYSYWDYGFSYFCIFAKLLYDYTDGEINYFENEKVHKIAFFQQNVLLNENECISFSDSPTKFAPTSWFSHFLKGIYPDINMPKLPSECPLPSALHMRVIFWTNPDMTKAEIKPISHIFHNAEWFLYHGKGYAVAAKAGHNNEFHNHNDVGSFIISKNGRVTFCDPGAGEYTKDYYSANRYDIFLPSARAHSVPIINGEYQAVGKRDGGVLVEEEKRFKLYMHNGYVIDTLKSATRDIECLDDGVRITDEFKFTEMPTSLTEHFVSILPIEIADGKIICGDSVLTYDKELFEVSLGTEIADRRGGVKETVYYADLTAKVLDKNMKAVFEIN